MNESDILNLKGHELVSALNENETFSFLKKDKSLLAHALEAVEDGALVPRFVKNKFAPKEAISKYPNEFMKEFLEQGFNPGVDGILELCSISASPKTDRLISKLIKEFTTNKYDAAFTKAVMNLSFMDDTELSETITVLMEQSQVRLILLNDLKEIDPVNFLRITLKLKGPMQEEAISLFDKNLVASSTDGD